MSGSVRSATTEHPSEASGLRTALATVCISGTLEDKLAAAAAAGFDGVEIFEPDLVVSALSPAEIRARCADLGLSIDLYQPFRDLDSTDPERYAHNLRRAERKFEHHGRAGHRPHPGLLRGGPGRRRRHGTRSPPSCTASPNGPRRTGCAIAYEALAWGTRISTYEQSWDAVRRADHPALGLCVDSFHILSRGSDPAGIEDIPGREAVLPPARRRPAHEHGRAAVEPPPPALPRPGRLGPARLPGPRAGRGLHRAAVARGVQRRLPPVRPAPRRGGRPPLPAGAARGDRAARAAAIRRPPRSCTGSRSPRSPSTPPPARPSRSCSPRSASRTPDGTAASRCSCGSRATPGWCSPSRAATARRSWRSASRPPTRPRPRAGPRRCSRRRCRSTTAPPRRTCSASPRRTARRCSSATPPPRASAGWPTSCRRTPSPARGRSRTSTTWR